ncbi:unnamed protein product [Blepharisma stoltei]|uniref:RRM domain-containing protein n=1 Tax=Blepharisma stoltei TaxID=1481888 RepID=A0AAU9K9Z2_9CILI|nr:unnamed protein product [Blepharisma stoltei]
MMDIDEPESTNAASRGPENNKNSSGDDRFIDASGCTLFVQWLTKLYSSEEALFGYFTNFGEISEIKLLSEHSCAFVRFSSRIYADKAISFLSNLKSKGENSVLNWIKVGPTFDIKQHILQSNNSFSKREEIADDLSKKDSFMRKLDAVELNLEYAAFHCSQYYEFT